MRGTSDELFDQIEELDYQAAQRCTVPPDWRVDRAFSERAKRCGASPAIEMAGRVLSYAELEGSSNRLARLLAQEGVRSGDIVALACEDVAQFAVGALAILKLDATYLSIDLRFPSGRALHALAPGVARLAIGPCGIDALLAPLGIPTLQNAFSPDSLARFASTSIETGSTSSHPAYLCYTSGTSGLPKGALIPHAGVLGLCVNDHFSAVRASTRMASCSTFGFDAITFEVWGALLSGACIVALDHSVIASPWEIASDFARLRIDCAFLTTSLFNAIVAKHPTAFGGLALLVVGGEPIDPWYVRKVFEAGAPPGQLVNGYGPTEATTFALTHVVTREDAADSRIPIGRTLPGRYARVLGTDLNVVRRGEPGELCLGGAAVALGYINAPNLTAEKFIIDPHANEPESRLYRTGDLCRIREDGLVDYLGRIDEQVKVKGYRVEPAGVAALLRQIPGVEDAVVLPRFARFGTKEIVAFLRGTRPMPVPTLRSEASAVMPDYMMPAHFVWVDDFPVTSNGKLDPTRLLEQLPAGYPAEYEETRPRNVEATISALLSIFRRSTGRSDVDPDTPLHDLGDSLTMIGVMLDVEAELGVEISPLEVGQPITARNIALCLGRPGDVKESNHEVFYVTQPWNLTPIPVTSGDAMAGGRRWTELNTKGPGSFTTRESIGQLAEFLESQLPVPRVECPIMLVGHSLGGVLVFELARRLEEKRYPVAGIVIVDSYLLAKRSPIDVIKGVATPRKLLTALRKRLPFGRKARIDGIKRDWIGALVRYEPGPLRTPILTVECSIAEHFARLQGFRPWETLAAGPFEHVVLDCDHGQVMYDPIWVDQVAAAISGFRSRLKDGHIGVASSNDDHGALATG